MGNIISCDINFLLFGLPLIIFLCNYNKVFKKKTFNYLFAMSIIWLILFLNLISAILERMKILIIMSKTHLNDEDQKI